MTPVITCYSVALRGSPNNDDLECLVDLFLLDVPLSFFCYLGIILPLAGGQG